MLPPLQVQLPAPPSTPAALGYSPTLLMHLSSGGFSCQEPLDPSAEFDPIDGGKFNVKLGKSFAEETSWAWMKNAYSVVGDGNMSLLGLSDAPSPRRWSEFPGSKFTCGSHEGDFALFSRYGVMHEIAYNRSMERKYQTFLAASKFFPVPKKNNKKRAIVDSRDAGSLCSKPPPVNLPPVPAVIRNMAACKYFWAADLRHWFYQLPIHENLQPLFSLRLNRKQRRQRMWQMSVLPMGWSWSPYLAQSIAWSIILFRNKRETHCLYQPSDVPDNEIPSHLPIRDSLGTCIGQIFLWYDNILVCCQDESKAIEWKKRIIQNAKALSAMWGADSCPKRVTSTVDYIGIHASHDFQTNHTTWCHTSDKCSKAQALYERLNDSSQTPRIVSQAVGYTIWDHTLRLRPLAFAHEAIDLLRTYCGQCTTLRTWDMPMEVALPHRQILQDFIKPMLSNEPLSLLSPDPDARRRTLVLASDAAGADGQYAGIVKLGSVPGESVAVRCDFPDHIANADISVKELWAAIKAVEMWSDPDCDVILGLDNTVARAQIRHSLGPDSLVNDLLKELYENRNYRTLKTLFIFSEDNVADPPSRGDALIDESRFWATHRILSGSHVYSHQDPKRRNLVWPCDLMSSLAQEDFLSFRAEWSVIGSAARDNLFDLLAAEEPEEFHRGIPEDESNDSS